MTFEDFDDEQPTSLTEYLIIGVFAVAAVLFVMFWSGCAGGDGDDQAQTITIVSGNDLGVDCSDNSQAAAEEEEDDEGEQEVAVNFADAEPTPFVPSGNGGGQSTPAAPVLSRANIEAELRFVKQLGFLPQARIQECNGGQIIANGVDANVDVQIDEIEEITGETDLVRLLRDGLRIKDGPSDFEEVLE